VIRALVGGGFGLLTLVNVATAQDAVAAASAVGALDGIVVDTALHGVGDATVIMLGTNIRVVTGENGRFHIRRIPRGRYLVTAQRLGYQPVSAAIDVGTDTLRLTFTLEPATRTLDVVRVSATSQLARLAGFESRRLSGFGQFLTEAEINRRNSVRVTELIRPLLSVEVLEVHDHGAGPPSYYAVSRRSSGRICMMVVVVDNVVLPTPTDLDFLPSPTNLAGIELYVGDATVPPVFASYNRGCGIILLWTK